MRGDEIVEAIMSGALDGHLRKINTACRSRMRIHRDVKAKTLALTLKVGDPVVINDITPKYLAGLSGTVELTEPNRGKGYATVKLDKPIFARGRTMSSVTGIPLSCLTVTRVVSEPDEPTSLIEDIAAEV